MFAERIGDRKKLIEAENVISYIYLCISWKSCLRWKRERFSLSNGGMKCILWFWVRFTHSHVSIAKWSMDERRKERLEIDTFDAVPEPRAATFLFMCELRAIFTSHQKLLFGKSNTFVWSLGFGYENRCSNRCCTSPRPNKHVFISNKNDIFS